MHAMSFEPALTIPERTATLGSIHTIVAHPPSTTHRQLSDAELTETGIAAGLLRCSVGLEDVDDLKTHFAQALAVARLPDRERHRAGQAPLTDSAGSRSSARPS